VPGSSAQIKEVIFLAGVDSPVMTGPSPLASLHV